MKKYHPIDVRYTGPSTAYRGSANRKPSSFHKVVKAPTAKTTKSSAASPWENSVTGADSRQTTTPSSAPSKTAKPANNKETGAAKPIKNGYLIILAIIVLIAIMR